MKLNRSNLKNFAAKAKLPEISPKNNGIVHFGVGGFHRAHQAVYTEDAMAKSGDYNWGITGIGVMESDKSMDKALNSQDCLYSIIIKPSKGTPKIRIVNSISKYIYGYNKYEEVFKEILDDNIKIITLTVTEGGYNVNQRTGKFDYENPLIKQDVKCFNQPKTIFGYLAKSLQLRMEAGKSGLTILSCDNIQHNGDVAKKMFLSFLDKADKKLSMWVESNCSFPNSMVDRITPQTSNSDISLLNQLTGIEDEWPVTCEPFTQWVIEDKFVAGRPKWELSGVQFVKDVSPYEKMKLRLLNASHQALAYLGYLHGYKYVHESAGDPLINEFVRFYMKNEVIGTLDPVPGIDLEKYQASILDRFSNPNIKDTLSRICEFTSDRIPIFNVPAMVEQLEKTENLRASAMILASWIIYAQGKDEQGNSINIIDNRKNEIIEAAFEAKDDPEKFLKFEDLFGPLCNNKEFKKELRNAYFNIKNNGAIKALELFFK